MEKGAFLLSLYALALPKSSPRSFSLLGLTSPSSSDSVSESLLSVGGRGTLDRHMAVLCWVMTKHLVAEMPSPQAVGKRRSCAHSPWQCSHSRGIHPPRAVHIQCRVLIGLLTLNTGSTNPQMAMFPAAGCLSYPSPASKASFT
jgi:hypothetical protein